MTILRIAWRNLGRNIKRSLLALGAIALAQTTLIFVHGFVAGSYDQMLQTITGPMIGHVQVHHPKWREERAIDLYIDHLAAVRAQLKGVPEVESVWPRLYSAALAAPGEKREQPADAEPAMIVGVDSDAESKEGGLLEALAAKALPSGNKVAVGSVLANRLHLSEGEQLALITQDVEGFPVSDLFTVTAIIESPVDIVKTSGVVMSIDTAARFLAMPDKAHEIVIRGSNVEDADGLARKIKALPALSGMEVLSWRKAAPELVRIIDLQGRFDLVLLAIVFVAAASGIANTSMMSTFERTHEFGMLLAIGLQPARLVRMVLLESVLLGLIGVFIGSAAGSGLVLLASHTGINYAWLTGTKATEVAFGGMSISYVIFPKLGFTYILLGFVAVTLTSALASTWPATLAAKLEPAKAMHQ